MKAMYLSIGLIIIFCISLQCQVSFCFMNVYPKIKQVAIKGDAGEPLFLTPLIESGNIKEAREKSLVPPLAGAEDVVSYSGYFTVNKNFKSNLFFWFFPAEVGYKTAPVVLWLQGGPGATSLFGLFTENGPLVVNSGQKLGKRKYSWSRSHSVIYIDNPVGTALQNTLFYPVYFSKQFVCTFVQRLQFGDDAGYARNETDVGRDLYAALVQFFKLFPELQKNEFYATGESYAGKYVPAISYTIHNKNPTAEIKINLQGMAIGNGYTDPEHMLNYGDYLYQIGLFDSQSRNFFKVKEDQGIQYIKNEEWDKAFLLFDELLDGDLYPYPSYFKNVTGFDFYFNYLHTSDPAASDPTSDFAVYVQSAEVRKAIHVGNQPFGGFEADLVEKYLQQDSVQSVRPWIQELLEKYRVVIYNGQLDIIVAYPLTLGALSALKWSGAADYAKASRHQWHVGKELAGYVKKAGMLTEILVRDAGHMVPGDQPRWALDLITRFTANKPFY